MTIKIIFLQILFKITPNLIFQIWIRIQIIVGRRSELRGGGPLLAKKNGTPPYPFKNSLNSGQVNKNR
jgi:hypothetical protein